MHWASNIARKIHETLPPFILFEDLESEAYLGLVKAARKYNFTSGVPFQGMAYVRVRGAVYDAIRRKNFVHTSTLQLAEFPDAVEVLKYNAEPELLKTHDQAALAREVERAKESLNPQDRKVIELRYERGLTGRAAAAEMGVGFCVSSLRKKTAVANLKRRLEGSPHFEELRRAA